MIIGSDEAGRGPVLGSMFGAAVAVPDRAVLPDGIADSKKLPAERRQALYSTLERADEISVAVCEVTPDRIDDPEHDLNDLTVKAHASAIADLVDGEGVSVIADACDTDEERFSRRLAAEIGSGIKATAVTARHGADDSDPLVGAASVVAKVHRERHVGSLADEYGDVGSGYPSDQTTRDFLTDYVADNGELPSCARSSWGTCRDVLGAAAQSSLDGF